LVLPAAITFTGVLIASTFMSDPQWIPLFLLGAILGLPAFLILFTARHPVYLIWFIIYLLALPVWNFVLPVYAYWHMDDFSWGETRKVEGAAGDDHSKTEGIFDASHIIMKRWHEYELERIKKSERFAMNRKIRGTREEVNESEEGSEAEQTEPEMTEKERD
jgi:chitin synthase